MQIKMSNLLLINSSENVALALMSKGISNHFTLNYRFPTVSVFCCCVTSDDKYYRSEVQAGLVGCHAQDIMRLKSRCQPSWALDLRKNPLPNLFRFWRKTIPCVCGTEISVPLHVVRWEPFLASWGCLYSLVHHPSVSKASAESFSYLSDSPSVPLPLVRGSAVFKGSCD